MGRSGSSGAGRSNWGRAAATSSADRAHPSPRTSPSPELKPGQGAALLPARHSGGASGRGRSGTPDGEAGVDRNRMRDPRAGGEPCSTAAAEAGEGVARRVDPIVVRPPSRVALSCQRDHVGQRAHAVALREVEEVDHHRPGRRRGARRRWARRRPTRCRAGTEAWRCRPRRAAGAEDFSIRPGSSGRGAALCCRRSQRARPDEERSFSVSATVWDRIEAEPRPLRNVLEHPFYQRWSRRRAERATSSPPTPGSTATPSWRSRTRERTPSRARCRIAPELARARRGRARPRPKRLWDDFLEAARGSREATATPETAACVDTWTRDEDPLLALARLYAIESGQPAISRTKLEGLLDHYGFEERAQRLLQPPRAPRCRARRRRPPSSSRPWRRLAAATTRNRRRGERGLQGQLAPARRRLRRAHR